MANNTQFSGVQPSLPSITPMGHPQRAPPPIPIQFQHSMPPSQQPLQYIQMASQQFFHVGVPSHTQQLQYSQPMQLPPPPPPPPPPPSQAYLMPDVQPNRSILTVSPLPQQSLQGSSNYLPNLGETRMDSLSYSVPAPSSGEIQIHAEAASHYHASVTTNVAVGGSAWPSSTQSITKVGDTLEQNVDKMSVGAIVTATSAKPNSTEKAPSDWIEHVSRAGKRYYYNKKMRLSSWEKPAELMTVIEKADASTGWKEITAPDGRKYYYNKVTKESKWRIPDEVKLARERVGLAIESTNKEHENVKEINVDATAVSLGMLPSIPNEDSPSSLSRDMAPSPVQVAPVGTVDSGPAMTTQSPTTTIECSTATANATEGKSMLEAASSIPVASSDILEPDILVTAPSVAMSVTDDISANNVLTARDGVSTGDVQGAKEGMNATQAAGGAASEEKLVDQEPVVYEGKQEAKSAFRALLESANVASDWSWDQAMRVIINDQRYGALKSLGERKQTFNEFLGNKKKQEAEERRAKSKKAREDFKKMLEESDEVTSSTRWSKAIAIFEDDSRFKAVERSKDREDLFLEYLSELEKKERAKALEEHKRNKNEYIEFLKSRDFIKASSQWRKVQDRLEADERCLRLEKIVRLEIFQEYLRDLEKEEEAQRKLQMEELRKAERKNRDEFRKLMEEDIAAGVLTAKTHWRDYCAKVKDFPAYLAVSSNTSGATSKVLFDDVAEELEKQYSEDKDQIKEALKIGKIVISSAWTLENFKDAISEYIGSPSDANIKLVFEELLERVIEKEEKEAKRRARLADNFYESLCASKEITSSSMWEDCKQLFEDKQQDSWFNTEESFFREIFEKHTEELKEKAREERKRREEKAERDKARKDGDKRKEKHRRPKEKGKRDDRHRTDGAETEGSDRFESQSFEGNKRSGREQEKIDRKRHQSSLDDMIVEENENDWPRYSHRPSIDRKKLKQMEQHASASEVDYDSRYRRYKKSHSNAYDRHYEEHGKRDFGEDGEVW